MFSSCCSCTILVLIPHSSPSPLQTSGTMAKTKTVKNGESTFVGGGHRILLFAVLALQWLCGVVSLGLTAYFMGTWVWLSSMHFMFGLCVVCISSAIYIIVLLLITSQACISSYTYFVFMWCAFIRLYKGYFLIVNLTFSHLYVARKTLSKNHTN